MTELRYMRDAIHSFISFPKDGLINKIIDTEEFQRLKYIRQLGLSYFTYPSALHSRFSHSLGAYWLSHRLGQLITTNEDIKKKLELAALLHDIGHGPFSHALEKEIKLDKSHEEISKEIIESDEYEISKLLNGEGIQPNEISKVIVSGQRPKGGVKYIENGVPSIGGEHITSEGDFNFENIRYIPEEFHEKENKSWTTAILHFPTLAILPGERGNKRCCRLILHPLKILHFP